MTPRELLNILSIAEKLKDTTRHCYTSNGRQESVADHTWMMTFITFLLIEEFPNVDMNKVLKMCIIHDLGECFIGDIPAFDKTQSDSEVETTLLKKWIETLPSNISKKMIKLYEEMENMQSEEAKIYKAFDNLEVLIQHNLSDLSTWNEKEKIFNLTYADDKVSFSDFLIELRDEIRKDTITKLTKS